MTQIRLRTKEDRAKGYPILLKSGTVIYTNEKGKYIVPRRSVALLERANIQFDIEPIDNNGKK